MLKKVQMIFMWGMQFPLEWRGFKGEISQKNNFGITFFQWYYFWLSDWLISPLSGFQHSTLLVSSSLGLVIN